MHLPRPRSPSRVRGAVLGIVTAAILAFPVGVLAGATFNDVPTSHPFYNDVEALVASGVTSGCGGGNYCPNAFVTRGQMAAFLNRLGALAPGKVPVVNADRLDGYHANGLSRIAQASSNSTQALTGSSATLLSVSITTPGAGFVHVTGTTTVYTLDAGCGCEVALFLNDGGSNMARASGSVDGGGANVTSVSNQWVFAVDSAGSHTFNLAGYNFDASAAGVHFRQLVAVYSPFGSTGGSTLGTSAPSTDGGAPAGN